MEAKAGDKVKIIVEDGEFTGILMPRPELLGKEVTVLKLESGYNIGINNKKIKKIKLKEKYKPTEKKKEKLKKTRKLPTVTILSTGGTISSKIDYRTGGVYANYTAEDFIAMCPEIKKIANIKSKNIMNKMSEDMQPKDWVKIAKETVKALKKSTGVVITQGTDTMHYTAAALSFLIKDLNKPVIITGAQRSIDRGSSDAFMNLICSVNAAAHYDGAITGICMHGTINDDYCLLIRGTNARKMHTTRRDTFRPINAKALAKIYPEKIEKLREDYPKRNEKTPQALKLDNKVALIHIYPGIKPQLIEYQAKKSHGIIIAATALGHVPTHNTKSLMPVLKKWAKKIPIIITSQTLYGRVHPYVYTPLRKLSIETGCIFAANTLPETAYAKLMVMLANTKTTEEAKQKMQENIAGEINERETAKEFLE